MDGLALETWNPMVQNLLKADLKLLYSIVPKTRKRTSVRGTSGASPQDVTNLRHGDYHAMMLLSKKFLKVRTVAISG
jgi:hypothetical protein